MLTRPCDRVHAGEGVRISVFKPKCRIPVKTIAMPSLSAAAITSSSCTDPPGYVAPACATASSPSGKGKKASEAADATLQRAHRLHGAMCVPLGSSGPRPPPVARVNNRVRLHVLAHAPCEEQAAHSSAVGGRHVTTFNSLSVTRPVSASCSSNPPDTCFDDRRPAQHALPPGADSSSRQIAPAPLETKIPARQLLPQTAWRSLRAVGGHPPRDSHAIMPLLKPDRTRAPSGKPQESLFL